jgi:hypothetical protein
LAAGGYSGLFPGSPYPAGTVQDSPAAESKATVDDTKRGEVIKKGVRMLHEDVATIAIFNTIYVYAMKANIDFKATQKFTLPVVLVRDVTVR